MRTLGATLICLALLPAVTSNPEGNRMPTVSAEAVTLRVVRRAAEADMPTGLVDSRDTLLVERPVGSKEGGTAGLFVLDHHDVLERVTVRYGRASQSVIQITDGVSAGDLIAVSDMQAWDAFERLRLRSP